MSRKFFPGFLSWRCNIGSGSYVLLIHATSHADNMAIMTKQHPSFKGTAGSRGGRGRGEYTDIRFEADKQTWKALDMCAQGRRGLIFGLFNKTKTLGGGDALERMLKDACHERLVLERRR